jgi:hypothetical protein
MAIAAIEGHRCLRQRLERLGVHILAFVDVDRLRALPSRLALKEPGRIGNLRTVRERQLHFVRVRLSLVCLPVEQEPGASAERRSVALFVATI